MNPKLVGQKWETDKAFSPTPQGTGNSMVIIKDNGVDGETCTSQQQDSGFLNFVDNDSYPQKRREV